MGVFFKKDNTDFTLLSNKSQIGLLFFKILHFSMCIAICMLSYWTPIWNSHLSKIDRPLLSWMVLFPKICEGSVKIQQEGALSFLRKTQFQ